jgi:HTH-type transcriptional regulator / antitoxin HigA
MTEKTPFTPDWVSPPGDTIADLLEEQNLTEVQLAEKLGYTTQAVNHLIQGKVAIDEEIALKLEQILGGTVMFWLKREAQYRIDLSRNEQKTA